MVLKKGKWQKGRVGLCALAFLLINTAIVAAKGEQIHQQSAGFPDEVSVASDCWGRGLEAGGSGDN